MLKTISIIVSGKVQGVWYRKYTVDKATELGISGFVKNLPDDSVYILATGTDEQLNALVQWCYIGSPKSRVEKVEVKEEELQVMSGFVVRR
ncbi:acylphosphatase [Lacibacter sp. MH-610]|uniref:acylphosphatase n=1 Tax=Lacibacter sp. MH-610 TaxID=3020883 RepID=UPI003891F813